MKRLVITVEDETVELVVSDKFSYDNARSLVGNMVCQALGFDDYENRVHVSVKVYNYGA